MRFYYFLWRVLKNSCIFAGTKVNGSNVKLVGVTSNSAVATFKVAFFKVTEGAFNFREWHDAVGKGFTCRGFQEFLALRFGVEDHFIPLENLQVL